ncbi:MAG: T9SS type B sorting domain-containing protein [Pedobacter sp.]|nr:MAG: T9SS type B sorting domain-containing protein [Pedobacter sp.]
MFKTPPQIFIPTGFTPNNDNRNDVVRPIAVGITKIEYFRIFNRWGELVFSTTTNGEGWNGKVKGKEQGTGVYAWVVKAVDYTGKEFFELLSLAVSAVNGCEMCVNAHEDSLIKLGTTEERIFDAVRIASLVTATGKVIF